ncbi:hypothetical protein SDC9_171044 [bioreactor metagenome]|uniref:Uncharacterized protein n=1 Tax=bioreactor metagenome TaxID=1076179 RepID=A0A645G9S1_9ZZZZ|nr:hypothetical protein [Oscillospiraceae bacterium]
MKTRNEYLRTLYEKKEKILLERKIYHKSRIISFTSAAAFFLIICAILVSPLVDIFHLSHSIENIHTVSISITEDNTLIRNYTDEKIISEIEDCLNLLSFSNKKPQISENKSLYIVTLKYSDGTEKISYLLEAKQTSRDIGITTFSFSINDILNKYK